MEKLFEANAESSDDATSSSNEDSDDDDNITITDLQKVHPYAEQLIDEANETIETNNTTTNTTTNTPTFQKTTNTIGNTNVSIDLEREQRDRERERTKEEMNEEEELHYFKTEWPKHEKHIFILSSAGKPVYSRYGDEQKLCSFMPVLGAISAFIDSTGDTIRTIIAGNHKIVFLFRGPIYLVAVAKTGEPAFHLARQLEYIHSQIYSSLTSGVVRIYETRAHFDIRTLLGNSTNFLDSLLDMLDYNPTFMASFILNAVCCLRLEPAIRNAIGSVMQSVQAEDLVYAILAAKGQLVNVVRLKKHALHPRDYHLILNFIAVVSMGRLDITSTVPVCLPKFNDRGYLHVYVSFLADGLALLLISTKPGNYARDKQSIERGLNNIGAVTAINDAMERSKGQSYSVREIDGLEDYTITPPASPQTYVGRGKAPPALQTPPSKFSMSVTSTLQAASAKFTAKSPPLSPDRSPPNSERHYHPPHAHPLSHSASNNNSPYRPSITSTPTFHSSPLHNNTYIYPLGPSRKLLLHFLYKDLKTSQFTFPRPEAPYNTSAEQMRLFRLYQQIHVAVIGSFWSQLRYLPSHLPKPNGPRRRRRKPHKVYYYISKRESVLAWVTSGFELFAAFGPLVSKPDAINACNQLLRWIKGEESCLFIMNTPVW
eukprot:TRINITY_DN9619_c0_g1_i1.p1 TRINITY_DN9619_c0_g1~~TRINITY_DN9619_c0_g1_i1.p1  ORF type:complete len:755 (+),score=126.39 TRINITY_DN9619_c0_g1_i1:298-2265(+)